MPARLPRKEGVGGSKGPPFLWASIIVALVFVGTFFCVAAGLFGDEAWMVIGAVVTYVLIILICLAVIMMLRPTEAAGTDPFDEKEDK
jgi:archaellum biogenesis protein FlaJ (TadC family)